MRYSSRTKQTSQHLPLLGSKTIKRAGKSVCFFSHDYLAAPKGWERLLRSHGSYEKHPGRSRPACVRALMYTRYSGIFLGSSKGTVSDSRWEISPHSTPAALMVTGPQTSSSLVTAFSWAREPFQGSPLSLSFQNAHHVYYCPLCKRNGRMFLVAKITLFSLFVCSQRAILLKVKCYVAKPMGAVKRVSKSLLS